MQNSKGVTAGRALLGAALMVAAFGVQGQDSTLQSFPQSPAWKHGHAFVAAFNSGDSDILAAFLDGHLSALATQQDSVTRRVAYLQRLQGHLGLVEPVEVSGLPHAAIVNVRSEQGGRDADIVVVVSGDGQRIDQLLVVENPVEQAAVTGASR